MKRCSVILVGLALMVPHIGIAQAGPLVLATSPATPRAGTLFRVTFAPKHPVAASERVIGRAGDEPLHFVRDSTGRFTALAAMPIDSRGLRVETGIIRADADTMGRAGGTLHRDAALVAAGQRIVSQSFRRPQRPHVRQSS